MIFINRREKKSKLLNTYLVIIFKEINVHPRVKLTLTLLEERFGQKKYRVATTP